MLTCPRESDCRVSSSGEKRGNADQPTHSPSTQRGTANVLFRWHDRTHTAREKASEINGGEGRRGRHVSCFTFLAEKHCVPGQGDHQTIGQLGRGLKRTDAKTPQRCSKTEQNRMSWEQARSRWKICTSPRPAVAP